jgi:hypothetical protein
MKLKLALPVNGVISQGFGGNANTLYKTDGLVGHPGIDIVSHYNDPIREAVIGFNKKWIYKILNKDNPDLTRYRAVCELIEADDGIFELTYGHCNSIDCPFGHVSAGTVIATEGNTGDVFVGGVAVTKEERDNGSKAGTHIHFQLRAVVKTRDYNYGELLMGHDGNVYRDENDYYYAHKYPFNGFRSCVDPLPYIDKTYDLSKTSGLGTPVVVPDRFIFRTDFGFGAIGANVLNLQKRLVEEGYATFTPIGIYGPQTKKAVMAYQGEHGILMTGYVGPITRKQLNT